MPIIINEIEISLSVSDAATSGTNQQPVASKEEIIKACVEQVMEIIKQKTER